MVYKIITSKSELIKAEISFQIITSGTEKSAVCCREPSWVWLLAGWA